MKVESIKVGTDSEVDQIIRTVHLWHIDDQLTRQFSTASSENATPISIQQESQLERAIHIAKRQPEVRTARIEEFRAQIEAGTYCIDSRAIAQKMLAE